MPRSIVEIERLPWRRTIFVPNIPKGAGVGIIWCTSLGKTGYNWNQDSHLTFTEHLSTLASSLLSSLSQISRVRHLFTKDGLKIILNSLIFRKLFYCSTVWSATFKQNIKKLQLMQNFAARILTDIRKYDHICPILHELDWLTVKVLLRLPVRDTTMIYKCYLQSAQKRTSKTREIEINLAFPNVAQKLLSARFSTALCLFGVISSLNTKFFQIWSSETGYGELNVCF